MSPVLFNVMMDGLLRQVQKTGYGVKMAGFYVGCLAYADDVTLISLTVSGLQAMLCECERFAQCNLMKFNVKKSVISVFRRRRSACSASPNFFLGGSVLLVKESICHLGWLFSTEASYITAHTRGHLNLIEIGDTI